MVLRSRVIPRSEWGLHRSKSLSKTTERDDTALASQNQNFCPIEFPKKSNWNSIESIGRLLRERSEMQTQ